MQMLLNQLSQSGQDQRQHGMAFQELGSQLALLSKLLAKHNSPKDSQLADRNPAGLTGQLAVAQQTPAVCCNQVSMIQAQPPQQQHTPRVGTAATTSEELLAARQPTEQQCKAGLTAQLTVATKQHNESARQLGLAEQPQVAPVDVSKQLKEDNKCLASMAFTQRACTIYKHLVASTSSSIVRKLQTAEVKAMERLPLQSVGKLIDAMDPSQPGILRAAAARELALRLPRLPPGSLQKTLGALQVRPQGVAKLASMLTNPGDDDSSDDTQLAGLEVVFAVWAVCSPELFEEIAHQPGVIDTLVQLLREGGGAKQAAAVGGILALARDREFCPPSLLPPQSDSNSWPIVSGLLAVLQSASTSAECKGSAAAAIECLHAHKRAISPGTANLPALTIAQLTDHMDPSQPAAARAAAARELARRLRELDPKARKPELAAFQAHPYGLTRLVQLLTGATDDDDTQVAALEALTALWAVCSPDFCEQIAGQPGVLDRLVQLLREGCGARQAAVVGGILALARDRGFCARSFYPPQSDPDSWPIVSGLVAVLQSPAASAECKGSAAVAIECLLRTHKRDKRAGNAQLHPAVQASIGPLVALLQQEDRVVQMNAGRAIENLAHGCQPNRSLIGAEPGAISKLWRLTQDADSWMNMPQVMVAVFSGHRVNESILVQQDGFMEDLVGLLGSKMPWRFTDITTQLSGKKKAFNLKLLSTPTAVPMLVVGLDPDGNPGGTNRS